MRRRAAAPGVHRRDRPSTPPRGRRADRGPTTRRSSSTASCRGWTSTSACSSSPRTRVVPLLERVKFCAIYTSQPRRVLHDPRRRPARPGRRRASTTPLRRRPHAGARRSTRIRERVARARATATSRCLERRAAARARRARHPHRRLRRRRRATQRAALAERFRRQIFPVLTPLAVGLGRPFPYISNLSLSLAVLVRDPVTGHADVRAREGAEGDAAALRRARRRRARRSSRSSRSSRRNLDALFPGMEIVDHGFFRVTRDADFEVSDEADDLLQAVEAELRRRRFGEVVRVEVDAGMDPRRCASRSDRGARRSRSARSTTSTACSTSSDLWQIVRLPGLAELRDPPWTPVTQPRLQDDEGEPPDVFAAMRAGDVLVHHPYDSFTTSVERFVEQAVDDPDVLAIKHDRLPHERRHAAGARAHPRDRARQAGGLPRGAQGALRRAREHRLGARARGGRACTSSTATRR